MPIGLRLAATMQAIEVCSRDYAGNLRPPRNWWLWSIVCQWGSLDHAVESIWRYLQDAHGAFESELPTGEGMKTRMIGAPPVLRLYQFVCDRVPLHELAFYSDRARPTAWDFPYSLATMLSQSDAETKGELSIFNIKDQMLKDYAEQGDKEEAAQEEEYEAFMSELQSQQGQHA